MSKSENKQKTVFVGLSGGVDSSVAAYMLREQGYKVVGCFIKTWQPDFIDCTWKEERRDAMRVAAHLGIPFLTIDLEKEYKEGVADYMIAEYELGRTPNPDVMCNKEIKFGGFLKKALEMGADFVATGHYARVDQDIKICEYRLLKAVDNAKEQSYFLWTLTQDQLRNILFPIGHLQKSEVRKIAKKAGLLTSEKKDSQGLCFIGKFDFKDFLTHFITPKKGEVLDEKGEVIGHHMGSVFFTLGERQGFVITKKGTDDKPFYVVAKDLEKNTLTVSHNLTQAHQEKKTDFELEQVNGLTSIKPQSYTAQIRYHGELLLCKITKTQDKTIVVFDLPEFVAKGQSIVVYDGDVCVGGGVVK
jgi:tRNA-specific 2-thiouridylase